MALRILDATTRTNCNAATSQQGQCEALIAPWAGGNVTARLFAPDGTTLLRTLTLGPFTINSNDPRGVVCAAHLADTHVATGTPGLWVFRSGSTDIFSIDAGTSGASVNHAGAVKVRCTPAIAGVVFTARSSLPVTPEPALFQFIDTLDDGEVAQHSVPSLTVSVSGLGTPFGASPEATAGPFDWLCYMPWDPTTKRIILAGGRAASIANATKVMIFDAPTNNAYSIKNPFGSGTGHIYQGPVVIPQRRLFLFRSFHTSQVFLWDIDSQTLVNDLPGAAPEIPRFNMGENPAWAWFPDWGPYGSVVVVGRDVDNNGIIVSRYQAPSPDVAFNTGTWQAHIRLAGPVASTWSDDHPAGCYVPAAAAGIFGYSSVAAPKQLLIVPSGGATPYWTADPCPGGVSVAGPFYGLITPHPTRAAAVIVSRSNLRVYTYEFASDTFVDRVAAAGIFATVNQGITTVAEKDAIVSLHGSSGESADQLWAWKVGATLG